MPGNTSFTGSDQAQPVRKLKKVQANQCLDQYELLVLNLPVRPVQLEHNVHESLGNMPSVQDEHSSEDSQAFQSLLISDSLDDNAHESGLGKCRHLRVKFMPLAFTGIFRNNPEYSGITWHFRKNNS